MSDHVYARYMLDSVNLVCSHIVESTDPGTFTDPSKLIRYWESVPSVKSACRDISEIGHRYEVPEAIIDISERILDPRSTCYLDEITLSSLIQAVL